MFFLLAATTALAAPLRPAATDAWVLVTEDALMCAHAGRQGPCARFLAPGVDPAQGEGPRVFRVVSRSGGEVQLQAQYDPNHEACGVLPARITPMGLRVFVPASAVTPIAADDSCVQPDAWKTPGPGPDPDVLRQRVATVSAGAHVTWPDGSLAGVLRRDLHLTDEHGPYAEAGGSCATFSLGADAGGPSDGRAFDLCFSSSDFRWADPG